MQWQGTINSSVVKWENRSNQSACSWFGNNIDRPSYVGATTPSGNDYTGPTARSGDPSAWTQGMMIQMKWNSNPTFKAVSGLTNTNPCQITCGNHGFSDGDIVFFEPGSFNSSNPTPPTWSSTTTYNKGSVIKTYNSRVWRSKRGSNLNHDPSTDDGMNCFRINNTTLNQSIEYTLGFYTVSNAAT